MITLAIEIERKKNTLEVKFIGDEGGVEIHSEDFGKITPKTKVMRRVKSMTLDGKVISFALNYINENLDKPKGKNKV